MGAGKTSLGKAVSKILEARFLDTDEMIVKAEGMTINEIFAQKGEEYFRFLETQTLKELGMQKNRFVLSVGGGTPLRAENRPFLHKAGCVIYLKPSIDTLEKRLKNDTHRPLLHQGEGTLLEKITRILEVRDPLYREAADVILPTGILPFMETAREIADIVS